jgi:hypothetical protein
MSRSTTTDYGKSIMKHLDKMIKERGMTFETSSPLKDLLEPPKNRSHINSFLLYCKDHSNTIVSKPGSNSKILSDMWNNEPPEKKNMYQALSNLMSTAYKETFKGPEPWDLSASMPLFFLNQKAEAQQEEQQEQQEQWELQEQWEQQLQEQWDQQQQEQREQQQKEKQNNMNTDYLRYYIL